MISCPNKNSKIFLYKMGYSPKSTVRCCYELSLYSFRQKCAFNTIRHIWKITLKYLYRIQQKYGIKTIFKLFLYRKIHSGAAWNPRLWWKMITELQYKLLQGNCFLLPSPRPTNNSTGTAVLRLLIWSFLFDTLWL